MNGIRKVLFPYSYWSYQISCTLFVFMKVFVFPPEFCVLYQWLRVAILQITANHINSCVIFTSPPFWIKKWLPWNWSRLTWYQKHYMTSISIKHIQVISGSNLKSYIKIWATLDCSCLVYFEIQWSSNSSNNLLIHSINNS